MMMTARDKASGDGTVQGKQQEERHRESSRRPRSRSEIPTRDYAALVATFNGLLASETRTSVTLVDTEGKPQALLREDIEELVASRKSLMPEGFEQKINAQEMADLVAYLMEAS